MSTQAQMQAGMHALLGSTTGQLRGFIKLVTITVNNAGTFVDYEDIPAMRTALREPRMNIVTGRAITEQYLIAQQAIEVTGLDLQTEQLLTDQASGDQFRIDSFSLDAALAQYTIDVYQVG